MSRSALLTGYRLVTMQEGSDPWGLAAEADLVIRNGLIEAIASAGDIDARSFDGDVFDGEGRFLTPGLIDCHTHLVWGGSRADEWEQRLTGVSYEEVARRGGGIRSTVRATRSASADELYAAARSRIEHLMRQGVTTFEIKSGYGLDVETEVKMLQVATDLRDSMPIDVQRTFLGAHAVPVEFDGQADAYIDLVCGEMMVATSALCEGVDVFCEGIGFTVEQTARVFSAAKQQGKVLRIHAEQLSLLGGARLAAAQGALSADHLEYLDEVGVAAMAESGTVAVLLPGAFYFIHEQQQPPLDLFRKHGVPVAVATDANPGSSPVASLLLMMNMACTLFRMTPAEAFAGVTRNAARALGWLDRMGTIESGKQADLVEWDIGSPAELAYGIGHNPCRRVFKRGEVIIEQG